MLALGIKYSMNDLIFDVNYCDQMQTAIYII